MCKEFSNWEQFRANTVNENRTLDYDVFSSKYLNRLIIKCEKIMKHAIIITGNLASGKSSLAKALNQYLPQYNHIDLDFLRKHSTENEAQRFCYKGLLNNDLVIFENIGLTRFFDKCLLDLKVNGYEITIVQLNCSPQTCLQRHKKRVNEGYHVPLPFAVKMTEKEMIDVMHDKLFRLKNRATFEFNTEKGSAKEIAKLIYDKLRGS